MPRRTWRDLEKDANHNAVARPASVRTSSTSTNTQDSSNLAEAARLAPESQLNQLLTQRNKLEAKLRGLTGEADQDPAISQRFPVASFAERRKQEQAWAEQRAAARQRQKEARGLPLSGVSRRSLPPSPLEGRMDAGLPTRSNLSSALNNRFVTAHRRVRSSLRRTEEGLTPLRSVSESLRQPHQSINGMRSQLRDLDQRLASEGVSDAERAELRDALRSDQLDEASAMFDRTHSALNAPQRAIKRVESGWQERKQRWTGAMDQFSSYTDRRDRRLSLDQGGSGDLLARMEANRQRALTRRREQQENEQRDQQRRERAKANRREREAADA